MSARTEFSSVSAMSMILIPGFAIVLTYLRTVRCTCAEMRER